MARSSSKTKPARTVLDSDDAGAFQEGDSATSSPDGDGTATPPNNDVGATPSGDVGTATLPGNPDTAIPPTDGPAGPSREQRIRERAYQRFTSRGGDVTGDPTQDWLDAESEIDAADGAGPTTV